MILPGGQYMGHHADLQTRTLATNGVRLHVVEAGPPDGPLVLLLHGFPEFWYGWHRQIGPLAAAGFRVAVPDQRGYDLSGKPKRVRAYNLDELALDVVGLIDALGRETAHVAGHDWGGAVAWWLGMKHAQRLDRLALLNIPHPKVLERALYTSAKQRAKSSYMFFFQLPWLPERALGRHSHDLLVRTLRRTSRPGTFSDEDLALYRAAWARPGALTGMLHWYRAALRARPSPPASPRVPVPTLMIWGTKDLVLGRDLVPPSLDFCDQGRVVYLEEATHWVAHEEPEAVSRLLVEHFGA
jgi:pimeloyl-ACP methyl ester carboxylesterase